MRVMRYMWLKKARVWRCGTVSQLCSVDVMTRLNVFQTTQLLACQSRAQTTSDGYRGATPVSVEQTWNWQCLKTKNTPPSHDSVYIRLCKSNLEQKLPHLPAQNPQYIRYPPSQHQQVTAPPPHWKWTAKTESEETSGLDESTLATLVHLNLACQLMTHELNIYIYMCIHTRASCYVRAHMHIQVQIPLLILITLMASGEKCWLQEVLERLVCLLPATVK